MTQQQWQIVVAGPAARDIQSIPAKYSTAIIELISALPENPRRIGKRLRFELEGKWVARRGPYRVIYRLEEAQPRVVILAVAHRAHIYRRP